MYKQQASGLARASQQQFTIALLALMQKHPFGQITVTMLCQEASLARKTFYRNFDSLADVLTLRLDSLLEGFLQDSNPAPANGGICGEVEACLRRFCAERELLLLLHTHCLFYLVEGLIHRYLQLSCCAGDIQAVLNQPGMEEYFAAHVAGSISSMLALWVQRGFAEPVDSLIHFTAALIPTGH